MPDGQNGISGTRVRHSSGWAAPPSGRAGCGQGGVDDLLVEAVAEGVDHLRGIPWPKSTDFWLGTAGVGPVRGLHAVRPLKLRTNKPVTGWENFCARLRVGSVLFKRLLRRFASGPRMNMVMPLAWEKSWKDFRLSIRLRVDFDGGRGTTRSHGPATAVSMLGPRAYGKKSTASTTPSSRGTHGPASAGRNPLSTAPATPRASPQEVSKGPSCGGRQRWAGTSGIFDCSGVSGRGRRRHS